MKIKVPFVIQKRTSIKSNKTFHDRGYLPSQFLAGMWLWSYVGRESRLLTKAERKMFEMPV